MKIIDVTSEDGEPPDWCPDLAIAAARTLKEVGITEYEVGILLCSDSRIAELNATYRGKDQATDVLSFSQDEGESIPSSESTGLRGDIAISLDSVQANASRFKVSASEESVRVAVHGVLHLAGFEHNGVTLSDSASGEHEMLGLQEKIVNAITKEQEE